MKYWKDFFGEKCVNLTRLCKKNGTHFKIPKNRRWHFCPGAELSWHYQRASPLKKHVLDSEEQKSLFCLSTFFFIDWGFCGADIQLSESLLLWDTCLEAVSFAKRESKRPSPGLKRFRSEAWCFFWWSLGWMGNQCAWVPSLIFLRPSLCSYIFPTSVAALSHDSLKIFCAGIRNKNIFALHGEILVLFSFLSVERHVVGDTSCWRC